MTAPTWTRRRFLATTAAGTAAAAFLAACGGTPSPVVSNTPPAKTVAASNNKFAGMSEADFDAMQEMAACLQEMLTKAMATGDAGGEAALAVAALHKQWLSYTWCFVGKQLRRICVPAKN